MVEQHGAIASANAAHSPTAAAVEGIARRLILIVAPLWLLPVVATAVSGEGHWDSRDTFIAIAAVALGFIGLLAAHRPLALVAAFAFAVVWLASHHPRADGFADQDLILEQWVNLAAWSAGLLISRVRASSAVVVAIVLAAATTLAATYARSGVAIDTEAIVALIAYGLTDGFAAVAAFAVMRRTARGTDARMDQAAAAAESLASQHARQHELRRISRLMHDTVVNTLCAVQLWEHTDARLLRERSAADLQLLQSMQTQTSTAPSALTAACRQRASLLGLDLSCSVPDDLPELPSDIATAMQGACWEALTNTAKHSGTFFATMEWSQTGDEVSLVIRDHGVGFDTDRRSRGGVAESVYARCAEVGVRAMVTSTPGSGTAMTLSWSPSRAFASSYDVVPSTPLEPGLAASVGWIAVTLGLFATGATLRVGFGPLHSFAGLVGLIVVALITTGTYRTYRTAIVVRPPAMLYVIAGALVVASPSLGIHGCARVGTWWWGPFGGILLGAYAAILDARRSAVIATICGTALGYLGAVATLIDGTEKCRQDTLAFLVLQSGIIFGLTAARRRHANIHRAGEEASAATALDRMRFAQESATQHARRRHVEFARSVAEPVLSGLADGSLSAADEVVRNAAARAESTMRLLAALDVSGVDEVAGVLSETLVAAHKDGILLHVIFTQDALPCDAQAAELRGLLEAFLAACPSGASAQLTLLSRNTVVCVIRAHVDFAALAAIRRAGWIATETDGQLLLERTLGAS